MQNFSPVVSFCDTLGDSDVYNRLNQTELCSYVVEGCGKKVKDKWCPNCVILASPAESDAEIFTLIRNDLLAYHTPKKTEADELAEALTSSNSSEASSSEAKRKGKAKKKTTPPLGVMRFIVTRLTFGAYARDVLTAINPAVNQSLLFYSTTNGKTQRAPAGTTLNDVVMVTTTYELILHGPPRKDLCYEDFSWAENRVRRVQDSEVWIDGAIFKEKMTTLKFPRLATVPLPVPGDDEQALLKICSRLSTCLGESMPAREVRELLSARVLVDTEVPDTLLRQTVSYANTTTAVYNAHGLVTDWLAASYFPSERGQRNLNPDTHIRSLIVNVALFASTADMETNVRVEEQRSTDDAIHTHIAEPKSVGFASLFRKGSAKHTLYKSLASAKEGFHMWIRDWKLGHAAVQAILLVLALPALAFGLYFADPVAVCAGFAVLIIANEVVRLQVSRPSRRTFVRFLPGLNPQAPITNGQHAVFLHYGVSLPSHRLFTRTAVVGNVSMTAVTRVNTKDMLCERNGRFFASRRLTNVESKDEIRPPPVWTLPDGTVAPAAFLQNPPATRGALDKRTILAACVPAFIVLEELAKYVHAMRRSVTHDLSGLHPVEASWIQEQGNHNILTINQIVQLELRQLLTPSFVAILIVIAEVLLGLKLFSSGRCGLRKLLRQVFGSLFFHSITACVYQMARFVKTMLYTLADAERASAATHKKMETHVAERIYSSDKYASDLLGGGLTDLFHWLSSGWVAQPAVAPMAKMDNGHGAFYNFGRLAASTANLARNAYAQAKLGYNGQSPLASEYVLRGQHSDAEQLDWFVLAFAMVAITAVTAGKFCSKKWLFAVAVVNALAAVATFFSAAVLPMVEQFIVTSLCACLTAHWLLNSVLGMRLDLYALTTHVINTLDSPKINQLRNDFVTSLLANFPAYFLVSETTARKNVVVNTMGVKNSFSAIGYSELPYTAKPTTFRVKDSRGVVHEETTTTHGEVYRTMSSKLGWSIRRVKNAILAACIESTPTKVSLLNKVNDAGTSVDKWEKAADKKAEKMLAHSRYGGLLEKDQYENLARGAAFYVDFPTHIASITLCREADQEYPDSVKDQNQVLTLKATRTCVSRHGNIARVVKIAVKDTSRPLCTKRAGLTLVGWGYTNGLFPQVFNRSCVTNFLNGCLCRVFKQSKNDYESTIESLKAKGVDEKYWPKYNSKNDWSTDAVNRGVDCQSACDEMLAHVRSQDSLHTSALHKNELVKVVSTAEWLKQFPDSKSRAIVTRAVQFMQKLNGSRSEAKFPISEAASGLNVHSFCQAFIKVEKAIPAKSLAEKPARARIIQASHPASQFILGPITYSTGKWLKRHLSLKSRVTYGGGMDAIALGRWFGDAVAACSSPVAYEVDGNAWDSTIGFALKLFKHAVFSDIGWDKGMLKCLRKTERIRGRTRMNPSFGFMQKSDEDTCFIDYTRDFTVRSGLGDTTAGNTLINASIIDLALVKWAKKMQKRLGMHYSLVLEELKAQAIVMGDDMLLVFDMAALDDILEHSDPNWHISLCGDVCRAYAEVGCEPEGYFHYNPTCASFCSKHFYRPSPTAPYVATPHLARTLLRSPVCEQVLQDPAKAKAWLYATALSMGCESGFLPVTSALAYCKMRAAGQGVDQVEVAKQVEKLLASNRYQSGRAEIGAKQYRQWADDFCVDQVAMRYGVTPHALRSLEDTLRYFANGTRRPIFYDAVVNKMFLAEKAQFGAIPITVALVNALPIRRIAANQPKLADHTIMKAPHVKTKAHLRELFALQSVTGKDALRTALKVHEDGINLLQITSDENVTYDLTKEVERTLSRGTHASAEYSEDLIVGGVFKGATLAAHAENRINAARERRKEGLVDLVVSLNRTCGLPLNIAALRASWVEIRALLLSQGDKWRRDPLVVAMDSVV